ncbi:hypothetical protein SNEBB_004886 [Seison nebaliae]|nr:hypothetical protein SNEBB_004886 [Seison nebaliae]
MDSFYEDKEAIEEEVEKGEEDVTATIEEEEESENVNDVELKDFIVDSDEEEEEGHEIHYNLDLETTSRKTKRKIESNHSHSSKKKKHEKKSKIHKERLIDKYDNDDEEEEEDDDDALDDDDFDVIEGPNSSRRNKMSFFDEAEYYEDIYENDRERDQQKRNRSKYGGEGENFFVDNRTGLGQHGDDLNDDELDLMDDDLMNVDDPYGSSASITYDDHSSSYSGKNRSQRSNRRHLDLMDGQLNELFGLDAARQLSEKPKISEMHSTIVEEEELEDEMSYVKDEDILSEYDDDNEEDGEIIDEEEDLREREELKLLENFGAFSLVEEESEQLKEEAIERYEEIQSSNENEEDDDEYQMMNDEEEDDLQLNSELNGSELFKNLHLRRIYMKKRQELMLKKHQRLTFLSHRIKIRDKQQYRLLKKQEREQRALKLKKTVYEPCELKDNLMTLFDDEVKRADVPERFALREMVPEITDSEHIIKDEAQWIFKEIIMKLNEEYQSSRMKEFNSIFSNESEVNNEENPYHILHYSDIDQSLYDIVPSKYFKKEYNQSTLTYVENVVRLIRDKNRLEPSYIAFHNRDAYQPSLDYGDLWLIFEWDEKFLKFRREKERFKNWLRSIQIWVGNTKNENILSNIDHFRQLTEQDVQLIDSALTFRQLEDLRKYYSEYYSIIKKEMIREKYHEQMKKRRKRIEQFLLIEKQQKTEESHKFNFNDMKQDDDDDDDDEEFMPYKMSDEKVLRTFQTMNDQQLMERLSELHRDQIQNEFKNCRKFYHAGSDVPGDRLKQEIGLAPYIAAVDLDPSQFRNALRDKYRSLNTVSCEVFDEPLIVAERCVTPQILQTIEKVLRVGRELCARRIAAEPKVRETVCERFRLEGCVDVIPTALGREVIDESHYLYSIKFLKSKPIRLIDCETFFLLHVGKKDGMVEIKLKMDSDLEEREIYVDEVQKVMLKDFDILQADKENTWLYERKTIIRMVFENFLYKQFSKSIYDEMVERGMDKIIYQSCDILRERMLVGPLVPYEQREKYQGKKRNKHRNKKADDQDDEDERNEEEFDENADDDNDDEEDDDMTKDKSNKRIKMVSKNHRGGVIVLMFEELQGQDNLLHVTVLNSQSEVVRTKTMKYIFEWSSGQVNNLEEMRENYSKFKLRDLKHLVEMGESYKIKGFIVTCQSRTSMRLFRDLWIYLNGHVSELPICPNKNLNENEPKNNLPRIAVEYGDMRFASISGNSSSYEQEFGVKYSLIYRLSIAVGRWTLQPVEECSRLFNTNNDILSLPLHPFQRHVNQDKLKKWLQYEMTYHACYLGVDCAELLQYPHKRYSLQFIGGFGPRKADSFIRDLLQLQSNDMMNDGEFDDDIEFKLTTRRQLVTCMKFGPAMLFNSSGFFRFPAPLNLPNNFDAPVILDGTRIHLEAYDYAEKIAIDAYEHATSYQLKGFLALARIKQYRDQLKELDLETYDQILMKKNGEESRLRCLRNIVRELDAPFNDDRQFIPLNQFQLFYLLNNESPSRIYRGRILKCRPNKFTFRRINLNDLDERNAPEQINDSAPWELENRQEEEWKCRVCQRKNFSSRDDVMLHMKSKDCQGNPIGVQCILLHDNKMDNLTGFLPGRLVSDSRVHDIRQRIKLNAIIIARIDTINFDRFSVVLTTKTSDLQNKEQQFGKQKDDFYDREMEVHFQQKRKKIPERVEILQPQIYRRIGNHPSFHNVSHQEANEMVNSRDFGEVVFRPSTSAKDRLVLHMRIIPNLVKCVQILEKEKENDITIGKRLVIKNEFNKPDEFEDLDEILMNYVSKISFYSTSIMHHRRYVGELCGKTKDEIEKYFVAKHKADRKNIPYGFVANTQSGTFLLALWRNNRVKFYDVTITPKGIKYCDSQFETAEDIIRYMKKNYKKNFPQQTPNHISHSSRSNNRSSSTVNSSIGRHRRRNSNNNNNNNNSNNSNKNNNNNNNSSRNHFNNQRSEIKNFS